MKKQFKRIKEHTFINKFDENSVIVDLGATKGEFSELFSKRYPYKKLILVEGNPDLIRELQKKFKNNSIVEIINAAIGTKSKNEVKFYISENLEASSLIKLFSQKSFSKKRPNKIKAAKVRMISLGDLFRLFSIKKIDLLKVDIEGSEWGIFENFTKRYYKRIDQISVEFHDFINWKYRRRTENCVTKLRKLGYLLIRKGTRYGYGTPYFDCLFYKK